MKKEIKTLYLYGYYPYEHIVESDRDDDFGVSYIALIYRQRIVALGIRHWSTSLYQDVYASVIDGGERVMKKRIWELKTISNPAARNLYAKIAKYKIADRNQLPPPPSTVTYRVRAKWCGSNVEYQIHQMRWCTDGRLKYRLTMNYVNVPGKEVELGKSDVLSEIADIISQRTKRTITLV